MVVAGDGTRRDDGKEPVAGHAALALLDGVVLGVGDVHFPEVLFAFLNGKMRTRMTFEFHLRRFEFIVFEEPAVADQFSHAGARHEPYRSSRQVFVDAVGGALPVREPADQSRGPRGAVAPREHPGARGG